MSSGHSITLYTPQHNLPGSGWNACTYTIIELLFYLIHSQLCGIKVTEGFSEVDIVIVIIVIC